MDPKKIHNLSKLIRQQGDKLLTSEFQLKLTGELLRALNDSFSLIIDDDELTPPQTFQVTKPNNSKSNVFRELMFIYDFIQKTLVLKLTKYIDDETIEEDDDNCVIDISKFRNMTTLEIQRVSIKRIVGLQQLRQQLQELVVEKSLTDIKDLIMHCAGDNCSGFIWNSLKRIDFSYNNLERVDNSFEFTPYIQFLNLSHNKIVQIPALVYLPNLKILNLSFNQLTNMPKLNVETYRRLQVLIINDNFIEDLSGLVRLDALLELDISGNCLLDHALLLPLCTLSSLRYLNMSGNPLAFHPKHRVATCRYLSKNAATVQFQLDGELLSKQEKSLAGSYENYYPIYGHRMNLGRTSSSNSNAHTPTTKSVSNTPDNTSLSSNISNSYSSTLNGSTVMTSSQKKVKPRSISEIEESGMEPREKSPIEKKLLREGSKDHLTTKREIEQLREQYGNEWLFNQDLIPGYENQRESTSKRRLNSGNILYGSPIHLRMDESFEASDPIETSTPQEHTLVESDDKTIYKSIDDSTNGLSNYASALEDTFTTEDETTLSDPEDNEALFIVVDETTKEDLILIIADKIIKERDAMTGKTLIKWGIQTLLSVERKRSNLIHLTFDTIRKDKKERFYRMEEPCCQEVEKILRDYLSSRPLSEMNQTVYKCPKCNSQFCRENDDDRKKNRQNDIKCPSCGNKYIIEIQKTSKCATSPKSSFFPGTVLTTLTAMQRPASSISIDKKKESAFDSNQSVAGSSVEVLSECSSQVSHTSQSSIEVIDQLSRKSEERRISTAPSLDTIDDDPGKSEGAILEKTIKEIEVEEKQQIDAEKPKVILSIGNVNLTESSSSGSICESVCTAYEQNGKKKSVKDETKSPLEGIFKTSSLLLSRTISKKEPEPVNHPSKPIQYNFDNLSIVDHRLKLFIFQNVLEDNDEKFMWLVKCIVIEDDTSSNFMPTAALVVMSTKKIYLLKIVGKETENVESWIRKSMTYSVDQIIMIRNIIFDNGLSFIMKANFNFHILLRDSKLSTILQKHITTSNQTLEISRDLSAHVNTKLLKLSDQNELIYLAMYNSCETSVLSATDSTKVLVAPKTIDRGMLVITTESIILTTNFDWLCESVSSRANDCKHVTKIEEMANLVELESLTKNSFTFVFMNELESTIEKWKLSVDSHIRIRSLLEETDKIWSVIFSIPLLSNEQNMILS
ncbi:unnamed protein product [Chironomus riparius]|uniref:Serine/threonine-protein kinase 11-interacting protein n=1 Tax=Chironomus riparius TaxID=315576 RepID=A0A9P0NF94_9DIPT|nr:unnamed protein product [Chironomus riparius]